MVQQRGRQRQAQSLRNGQVQQQRSQKKYIDQALLHKAQTQTVPGRQLLSGGIRLFGELLSGQPLPPGNLGGLDLLLHVRPHDELSGGVLLGGARLIVHIISKVVGFVVNVAKAVPQRFHPGHRHLHHVAFRLLSLGFCLFLFFLDSGSGFRHRCGGGSFPQALFPAELFFCGAATGLHKKLAQTVDRGVVFCGFNVHFADGVTDLLSDKGSGGAGVHGLCLRRLLLFGLFCPRLFCGFFRGLSSRLSRMLRLLCRRLSFRFCLRSRGLGDSLLRLYCRNLSRLIRFGGFRHSTFHGRCFGGH